MSFQTLYKTLFDLTIHHGYFLDDGESKFNLMTNDEKDDQLKNYDFSSFLEIIPSLETKLKIKNLRFFVSYLPTGIKVLTKVDVSNNIKPFIPISLDTTLTLLIKVKDFLFENYTNLDVDKHLLYAFTNKRPATEAIGFPNISLFGDTTLIDNSFKTIEDTTTDILKTLNVNEKLGLFGIIQLSMQGDAVQMNILNNSAELLNTPPHFKIHFDNRKTFWKYLKSDSSFEVETQTEKPLTKSGFIEIDPAVDFNAPPPEAADYKYPNPTPSIIKKEIVKTYSEIFI